MIVPCGIGDRSVTSLSRCAGREIAPEDVAPVAASAVAAALGRRPVWEPAAA
jgi:lipoate-protein ligase B